jgi:hypothetical protein
MDCGAVSQVTSSFVFSLSPFTGISSRRFQGWCSPFPVTFTVRQTIAPFSTLPLRLLPSHASKWHNEEGELLAESAFF